MAFAVNTSFGHEAWRQQWVADKRLRITDVKGNFICWDGLHGYSLLPRATHHPVFYLLTYIVLINSIRLALEYFFF